MKEMPKDLRDKAVVGFMPWGFDEFGGIAGSLKKVSVEYNIQDGKSLEPAVIMEFENDL
jgi:hypothetical protein